MRALLCSGFLIVLLAFSAGQAHLPGAVGVGQQLERRTPHLG